jgi:hypothetical protein
MTTNAIDYLSEKGSFINLELAEPASPTLRDALLNAGFYTMPYRRDGMAERWQAPRGNERELDLDPRWALVEAICQDHPQQVIEEEVRACMALPGGPLAERLTKATRALYERADAERAATGYDFCYGQRDPRDAARD